MLYLLIGGIVYFNVYAYTFDKKVDLNGDNVGYFILGNSIAQGKGYSNIHTMEERPANHFPPGYPFIISIPVKLFDASIQNIKQLNGLFFLGAMYILFLLTKRLTRNVHLAFVILILGLLNPASLRYATIMMSEIPFMFFSLLVFYLVVGMDLSLRWYKNPAFYASLACLVFAYYIRTTGIAILAGVLLYLLAHKKWKYALAYFVGLVLLALPWAIRSEMLGGNPYVHQLLSKNPYRRELGPMLLSDWPVRFWSNLERYVTREIPLGLWQYPAFDYRQAITTNEWIIGLLFLAAIVFGLVKLRDGKMAIAGYLAGTFGILLLWPEVWTGPRFVLSIIPVLLFLFLNGCYQAILLPLGRAVQKPSLGKALALPLLLFVFALKPEIQKAHNVAKNLYPPQYKNYFETAQWAATNTPADAVIACRKPGLFFIFSGRKVTRYPMTADQQESTCSMEEDGIDYVVVDQLGYSSTQKYLVPVVNGNPQKFQKLLHLKKPDTYIFRFLPHLGYAGPFNDSNQRHGHGTFAWPNGNRFEGEWENGTRNGSGVLTLANGQRLVGTWKNDKMVGQALLYPPDSAFAGN